MRLSELQALTPKLQVIAERYGASNIAVFGSVARDEATEASYVDWGSPETVDTSVGPVT